MCMCLDIVAFIKQKVLKLFISDISQEQEYIVNYW